MAEWIRNPKKFGTTLIIPLQVLMNVVGMVPLIIAVYISLTDWTPTRGTWWTATFTGGTNYLKFMADEIFASAILRTLLVTGVCTSLEFFIGLILAIVFTREFIGKKVFTSILLLPMMVIPAVSGYMFYMLFQREGPFSSILSSIMGTPVLIPWLSVPSWAMVAVMLTDIWQWTPFVFLVLLSGALTLPLNQINAAKVLGASSWQQLRYIILPMLKPIIILVLILRGIEALKMFDALLILTGGGPGYATQTVSVYLYEQAFKYARYGYAAAEGIAIMVVIAIASWFLIKPLWRR